MIDPNTTDLIDWLASVSNDPVAFAYGAFPWGEVDTLLEKFSGPEPWQLDVLTMIRDGLLTTNEAIQIAVASGHGIGKSALVAIIILWAYTTAPDTLGVVTANTETQLKTKTWARLGEWFNMFIGRDYFQLTATALLSRDPQRERTWRIDMVPWSEKNTEAFAGLHNRGKRVLLIMDEASAIIDKIWEVAEGALTDADTQIIWTAFGNPTRNSGRFKECFGLGRFAKFWHSRQIDSRSVSITNKAQISRWVDTYGEDSDFVRIRVRGVFPRTGAMEFFPEADILAAMEREVTTSLHDPLALGVDVARFGQNSSVLYPRKGRDAKSIPSQTYQGLSTVELASRIFEFQNRYHPDGIFIDGGGVGGGVVDNVRQLRLFCHEVQFGGRDDVGGDVWGNPNEKYANKRAAMYGAFRAWLRTGAIPNNPRLREAMLAITYYFNNKDEIVLDSKEDILKENPDIELDELDGLVLTFAYPLSANARAGGDHPQADLVQSEYDPFDPKRMAA